MPDRVWEKTASRKTGDGPLAVVLKVLTLGIAANPEPWQVEYTNHQTGEHINARGATEADADNNARARFTRIGAAAAAH